MDISERKAKTAAEYAREVMARGHGLFQSRTTRDAVVRFLKASGLNPSRGSTRGQLIHPEYVTDYVGTLETGLGNTMYRTYFKVLYRVELHRGW